ncbi:MAG TPA: NAD(P)/FAD-dependent oxidoreductase [Spirochaetota bacterium]|nr:NAD(P)/FAD-dependent oxidoreductase [Spirochaetota bacterium]
MYDVAIIGAGIIGALIARELSRYNLDVVLLERCSDVANGTTKANSGIIHAGYDAIPGSNKARFNVLGNPLFDGLCEELDVAFRRIGSLVVAFGREGRSTVEDLYGRGIKNGIEDLRIVEKEELLDLEPNLNDTAVCALLAPGAGIIDPWAITIAAVENAVENGLKLCLNFEVVDIENTGNGYRVSGPDREVSARHVINCSGVFADEIHGMVAPPSFSITPRKGQYFVLDKTAGSFVNHVILQCPTEAGKGVLVSPTVHGNLIVGPDAQAIDDKADLDTTNERLDFVRRSASIISDRILFDEVIHSFAGIRATPNTKDFIIEESKEAPGFIDVAGIESPGLTAAPAIAQYVREILKTMRGGLEKRTDFSGRRKRAVRFMGLSDDEKNRLIRKDPRYGRIVCRCEQITEGEVVDAIRRKAGATTVDGVKKRARPGMGRCQGGFCEPLVLKILARELGKDITEVVKDEKNSYILTGSTKYDKDELPPKEECIGR